VARLAPLIDIAAYLEQCLGVLAIDCSERVHRLVAGARGELVELVAVDGDQRVDLRGRQLSEIGSGAGRGGAPPLDHHEIHGLRQRHGMAPYCLPFGLGTRLAPIDAVL